MLRNLTAIAALLIAAPAWALSPASDDLTTGDGLIEPADEVMLVHYACEDDAGLDAVFVNTAAGNSFAITVIDSRLVPMEVAMSASGARYVSIPVLADAGDAEGAGAQYQLWTKGDGAMLSIIEGEDSTDILTDCRAEP